MAAAEPLLVPTPPPPPQLHDFTINLPSSPPQSFNTNTIFPHPIPPPLIYQQHQHGDDDDDDDHQPSIPNSPSPPPLPSSSWARKKIQRCKTAPAMAAMKDFRSHHTTDPNLQSDSSSLVRQAAVLLLIYLSLGVVIYSFNRDHFSGVETHPVVDALYFFFACVFVLVGFGFIDILLSGVVNYVLDLQENMILAGIKAAPQHTQHQEHNAGFSARNYIVDVAKGRMRIRLKVSLALGVVLLCIGMGTLVLYFVEHLDLVDSVYLSVMSVTTVGYGDRAFKTLPGRLFASIWLLFSTLAVARAFLYLAEARIDKRHRKITNWVLHRDITVEDLLAADINNNGFISKSEYIIYKLKEMGKIREKDILQICDQFNKLDRNNSGKITLPDLLENHL
ncbi:hypothetical protein Pfo_006000 [Paulownia fortunei]|nr:hypothetical protein Pfo_006000 [Paulownia fortunei]